MGRLSMDPDAPSVPLSPPALLKSYKWRTATPGPGGDPQKFGVFPQKLGGSPGSRRWARLQGWRRSHSHPDTVGDSSGDRGGDRGGGDKGGDKGGGDRGVAKASARRSLFRRAISAPCKAGKAPPLGTSPASLGTSPPPLVAPVPPDATQVWDVSQFSLLDGHLVPLPRDNEQGPWRSRTRAGSAASDGTNAGRRDPDPDERGPRAEPPPSSQLSNVKGLLWKRLLRDRRSRGATKGDHGVVAAPDGDRVPSRSGSRESLVPPPELDLTGDNVIVRPVHGSLVGERFCFQVITPAGSRSFGCSSLAERDRWIEELRRTAQPNKDNCERLDLSLSLSLFEGRHLPARRRLRCHLQLDGAVFARTTAKPPGNDGQLFWGELFHLAALPPARALTVTLCHQHQHHHDDPAGWHPVASVTIPLAELAAWQPLERWYTLSGAGVADPAPALRLRGRYRRVRVLPIVRYKELAEFVTFHYRELCGRLEPAIATRHKEELAGALVRVLQSTGKAKSFLTDLGVAELDRLDDREALIFRENTLATKAIDEYMKLVGAKYLQDTLGEVVAQLCSSEQSFEVDPSKISGPELSEHQQHLRQVCEETLRRITDGSESFPSELAEVFSAWWDACAARGKEDIGRRLVSASLFLRFLCPAIMSPSLFGLVQEYPGEATARSLTLVAKVIQNLANFTTFGDKEPYMTFMNGFLEHHWATMTEFLHAVSTPEASAHMATYDGVVDLALELATLHLLLCDIFSSLDQATQEELEPLPTILRAIREGTPVPVSVQLSSTTGRSPSDPPRPGFLPPRDLPKHSPLLKSQSLTSVRRLRAHDEGTTTVPPPVPPPVPPLGTPSVSPPGTPEPVPARRRRHVQRTQSVPAQGKGARCPPEGDSAAEGTVTPPGGGTGAPGSGDGPPRGKLRSSASLPRKPSVPWQRLAEDAAAPGELYGLRPLEKHGRLLEALRAELAELRQRLERAEARAARAEERHRERLERLRGQLDEGNARAANLAARLTAAEGTRRKDLERLKSNEERGRELERRLSGLEQELRRARGHHDVPKVSPRGHHEPGDDSDATSV